MAHLLFVLGPGRVRVERPPLEPREVPLPLAGWTEGPAALRFAADGVAALLLPQRDGRFRLRLELPPSPDPIPEHILDLPDTWVLLEGAFQAWARRRAEEAAIILGDEAECRQHRLEALQSEIALVDIVGGERPPGPGPCGA
jgi:hypothetical protein